MVLLRVDAFRVVVAGRCDHPQQRLAPRTERGVEYVDHRPAAVLVDFVDEYGARIEAVERALIGRQRLEL